MTKNTSDYKALLRTGIWFSGLPEPLADALLAAGILRDLASGERLFSRGDAPDGLYAIVDGAIRVSGVSESGKEAVLTLLEAPQWFGEVSVFDGQPRTHDAIAEGATRVINVPQPALDGLFAREPRWWRDLGVLVTHKLRLAFITLEDVALLPVSVRLARRLALMAEGYGERRGVVRRTVELSQDQLAHMLAVSRQTVNHLLKDLETRGLIRISYASIEIVDLDALRREAKL
jgi:CRP/FNR family transcriptional regulator, cyclic AMP receptor protein